MVKGIIKFAGKVAVKAKSILFADPKLLYQEERHLVNKPFFFEGTNRKGVLLVHGWTCTPYEVRRLGKYLNENGYTVSGIMLSGHGTVPKDLEGIKWEQWVDDVRSGVNDLKKTCDKVFIAGTSIGSNLAVLVAVEQSDIAGLVLMAMPYKLRIERIGFFIATMLVRMKKQYRKKFYPPTFGASTTITRVISYQTYPIASALESFKAIKASCENLGKVIQPSLIMQSTHDHMVAKGNLESIYDNIGSKIKHKKYIQKAYHTFISDIKKEHVFQDILNFLNEN